MDQECYKLCKDLYEKTSWKGVQTVFTIQWQETHGFGDDAFQTWASRLLEGNTPVYTSDYLLDQLPKWIEPLKNTPHLLTLQPNPIGRGWQALYRLSVATPTSDRRHAEEIHTSDTPLKALLKLTIALHEAGELKAGDA